MPGAGGRISTTPAQGAPTLKDHGGPSQLCREDVWELPQGCKRWLGWTAGAGRQLALEGTSALLRNAPLSSPH